MKKNELECWCDKKSAQAAESKGDELRDRARSALLGALRAQPAWGQMLHTARTHSERGKIHRPQSAIFRAHATLQHASQ